MKEKYDIGKQMGFIHHMIRRNLEKEIPSDLMKISMTNGYTFFTCMITKIRMYIRRTLRKTSV